MLFFDERHRLVGVGLRKDIEIIGTQVMRPGLEDLDHLGALVDLVDRVRRDGVGRWRDVPHVEEA